MSEEKTDEEAKAEVTVASMDKKKIETVKYLLSSLFARKQKYLIVDGNNKNKLIYSNFPYERIINYRPTPEDTVCGVMINDTVAPVLYEAFPIFGNIVAEIKLMAFMSAFNKTIASQKDKWPELYVDKDTDLLYMKVIEDKKCETFTPTEVGRLLPPDSTEYYDNIMKQFMSFAEKPMTIDFELPQGHFDDPVILNDLTLPDPFDVKFICPLKDGVSAVSFKEYLTKRKLPPIYHAVVQYRPESMAMKIAFHHQDDWVDCMSMMPGTLWFPFTK